MNPAVSKEASEYLFQTLTNKSNVFVGVTTGDYTPEVHNTMKQRTEFPNDPNEATITIWYRNLGPDGKILVDSAFMISIPLKNMLEFMKFTFRGINDALDLTANNLEEFEEFNAEEEFGGI